MAYKQPSSGPFKMMGSSPAKQTKFPIPAAKRITKKHVKHTTVDSPRPQDESKFDKSEKKMIHADKLLKKAGYDLGEREQATGAGGYKAAMDWATSKEKKKPSPAKQKTGKGTVSLRDARGGRGSLDFWNQTPDETKVAKRRGAREHYVANDNFSKNKKPANFNMEGGKTTTPGHGTTKMAKAAKKVGKVAKKVAGKAAKFAGGKALGVAGMLMATSSKADQPKGKAKSKGSHTGDFTKLRK